MMRCLHRLKQGVPQRFTNAGLLVLVGCIAAAVLGLDTRLN